MPEKFLNTKTLSNIAFESINKRNSQLDNLGIYGAFQPKEEHPVRLDCAFTPKDAVVFKLLGMKAKKFEDTRDNYTPTSTCAYDTGVQETIDGLLDLVNSLNLEISKERDCKNKAYFFILENDLLKEFEQFKSHSNNPIEFINNLISKKQKL